MLAKSFLERIKKYASRILLCIFLLHLAAFLSVLGCKNTPKHTIGTWKTVLAGDWSARLYDVHFVSETHGWAVGNSVGSVSAHNINDSDNTYTDGAESIILHTENGGENWYKQQSSVFGNPLRKVFFRNSNEGWSVGEGGVIIRTADGGKNWLRIESGTQYDLHSLYIAKDICWIVGDWGTLLKSVDGGKSFEILATNFGNRSIKGIQFIDKSHGWLVTYSTPNDPQNSGYIYHTQDGGQTWKEQFKTGSALFNLHFVDRLTGWVVGDRRSIYLTDDGGQTWRFLTHGSNERHTEKYGQPEYLGDEPLHTFTLYDLDFADNHHGWIVGDLGVILHIASDLKKNGTRLWKHQRGGPRFHNSADAVLLGVDFVSNKLGWAVGENGTILHTRNGGRTWKAQSTPTHLLFDICTTVDNTGYVVGDRGAILQTNDNGSNWQAQDSRITECFGGTHFVTPKKGWAVAETGVILHTTNGGVVWQRQTSNTKQDLLALYFLDEHTGWCVGSAGEILHTADGGKTWTQQKSGVTVNLFDIHFTSKTQGWAAGLFGTLLHTNDGGQHWHRSTLTRQLTKMNATQNTWLNAVYFVSPQIGWVVGVDGSIFHTDDTGKTWTRQKSHTLNFLYDVFFISKEEGWIVGKEGLVLHTIDAGTNWRPQRTNTQTDLTAIHMNSPHSGLITGQSGTILKYQVLELE